MGMSPTHRTTIVIIGAGYAGIMAANRIASHPMATALTRVRLISASTHLVERIRLHEALRAEEDPVRPLSELLNPAIDVVIGRATSIDRKRGVVHLSDGDPIPFDQVVLATGSTSRAPAGALPISGNLSALHTRAFASSAAASPGSRPPRNLLSKDSMLRSSTPAPLAPTSVREPASRPLTNCAGCAAR